MIWTVINEFHGHTDNSTQDQ